MRSIVASTFAAAPAAARRATGGRCVAPRSPALHRPIVHRDARRSPQSIHTLATTSDQVVTMPDAFERIKDIEVVVVGQNTTVPISSLWTEDQRCILFFARHMG